MAARCLEESMAFFFLGEAARCSRCTRCMRCTRCVERISDYSTSNKVASSFANYELSILSIRV